MTYVYRYSPNETNETKRRATSTKIRATLKGNIVAIDNLSESPIGSPEWLLREQVLS